MIPFDKEKPMHTSGIRIGTPAMVSKGFNPNDFKEVVRLIDDALRNRDNPEKLEMIKEEVIVLTQNHTEVEHNDLDNVYYPDVDLFEDYGDYYYDEHDYYYCGCCSCCGCSCHDDYDEDGDWLFDDDYDEDDDYEDEE